MKPKSKPSKRNKTAARGRVQPLVSGADLIKSERERQIKAEGWTSQHDDEHDDGELATAAACYAAGEDATHVRMQLNSSRGLEAAGYSYDYSEPKPGQITWPWDAEWYKPESRKRTLVKAGALIAAEIDRLSRAERGTTNVPVSDRL